MEMNVLKRYASPEMLEIFSDENRTLVWRRIWIALARAQRETGLDIPEAAIASDLIRSLMAYRRPRLARRMSEVLR